MIFGSAGLRRWAETAFQGDKEGPSKKLNDLLASHREELLTTSSHKTKRGFLRALLKLAKPYYWDQSDLKEKAIAWALLTGTIALTYYNVSDVAMGFLEINRDFMNLLQSVVRNGIEYADQAQERFVGILQNVGILMTKALAVGFVNYKIGEEAALRWRNWMTKDYENLWASNGTFYHMLHRPNPIDNPDQRIHEDPKAIPDFAFTLTKGALDAALSVGFFAAVLWNKSTPLTIGSIDVPAFLFTFAMSWAAFGTAITYYTSKPLQKYNHDQQAFEGSYRGHLRGIYEAAEPIVLNDAEDMHKTILRKAFDKIYTNSKKIINVNAALVVVRTLYGRIGGLAPIVVCFPYMRDKKMGLDDFSEVANSFGEVQSGISFYVNNASSIRTATAYMNRLIEIRDELEAIDGERKRTAMEPAPPSAGHPLTPEPGL